MPDAKVALVIGAGDATGGAIARRFAREGFTACVTRRNGGQAGAAGRAASRADGGKARGLRLRRAQGRARWSRSSRPSSARSAPIEVAVFNIGANVRFPIRETTARVYFKVWEMACFAGFLMGREVAKAHGAARPRHHPLHRRDGQRARRRRASPPSPAPSTALRALAQSMARELGPQGIHVAHVVIDGAIDTEFIRSNFPERYALKDARRHPRTRCHRRGLLAAAHASRATPGRTSWTCGPGWRHGDAGAQPRRPSSSISISAARTPTSPTR